MSSNLQNSADGSQGVNPANDTLSDAPMAGAEESALPEMQMVPTANVPPCTCSRCAEQFVQQFKPAERKKMTRRVDEFPRDTEFAMNGQLADFKKPIWPTEKTVQKKLDTSMQGSDDDDDKDKLDFYKTAQEAQTHTPTKDVDMEMPGAINWDSVDVPP